MNQTTPKLAMSTPLSPELYGGDASQGSSEGAMPSADKSVLSSLNFFKSLSEKRATRGADPPKRRGPKPDSKPALTRRQELNRQAQRTHRERKELYIKALEDEVLRLKEIFSAISQDKQTLADENRQLKELLTRSGIHFPRGVVEDATCNRSGAQTSNTSVSSNSLAPSSQGAFSPPVTARSSAMSSSSPATQASRQSQMRNTQQRLPTSKGVDLEQAGIDFVLTLEKPCMQHMPFLVDRANETGGEPCGHALMASCPPAPFPDLSPALPFGNMHTHDAGGEYPPQGTWELSKADLSKLLDLSEKLDLDGEITPVMAWKMVLSHPRSTELILADFERIAEELLRKVRCYGFGAVMEEFELRDAMQSVFSNRADAMVF